MILSTMDYPLVSIKKAKKGILVSILQAKIVFL